MKKMMAGSGVCGMVLASLVLGAPAHANDAGSAADEFIETLTADAARGDTVAAEALEEHAALSPKQAEVFENAIELLAEGADPAGIPGVDVAEEAGSTPIASLSRAGAQSWSAWCSQRASVLGVVVTETRVDGDFDTNAGKVTGIRNQRAKLVTNFVPLVNVQIKEVRKETGTTGTVRALIRVDRGPLYGIGSQVENWQSLAVNGSGKVTSCRWGW